MSLIEIQRRDAVAIVRFNNPPKGYMSAAMVGAVLRSEAATVEGEGSDGGVQCRDCCGRVLPAP